MKTILFLFATFITQTIFSQDYETLQKSDTIYVLFKGGKHEKKGVSQDNEYRSYDFYGLEQAVILLQYKYLSYEKKVANIVADVKVVDKSFKKTNKAKIITPRFLKREGLCKVVADILNHHRTIYVIDCTEKKDNKVVLYEVQMSTICRGDG